MVLVKVNLVLLMSVNAGFGGQKFQSVVLDKVKELKTLIAALGLKHKNDLDPSNQDPEYFKRELKDKEIVIEVDGGVNVGKISEDLTEAGFDIFVACSAVYGAQDLNNTVMILKGMVSNEQSIQE